MPTSKVKGLDEQQLEGGISGAGGSGGKSDVSSWSSVKQFEKLSPTAEKAQAKIDKVNRRAGYIKTEIIDLTKGSKSANEEAARNKELTASRRQEALDNAKTEGIKTEYPYIEPTNKKAGGTVTASRRADGIAMRGKTRGKMC